MSSFYRPKDPLLDNLPPKRAQIPLTWQKFRGPLMIPLEIRVFKNNPPIRPIFKSSLFQCEE